MFSKPIDQSERVPRMHGPVTDQRIAYVLGKLRSRKKGHLLEAILLLEAVQHERATMLTIDTTNAQMTPSLNVNAAAGGIPVQVARSSPRPCCHCDGTGRERDGSACTDCNGTCCSQHYKGVDPSCGTCRIA